MQSWLDYDYEELGGHPVLRAEYQDIRQRILTGDALVWAGDTILQRGIRSWEKPECSTIGLSHASLVIRPAKYDSWEDRVFMIEATGNRGLHPRILSEQLIADHGRCFHISTNLTSTQRMTIEETAVIDAASGIKYDFGGCLYNLIGRALSDARKYFCSEYVGQKWADVGYIPRGKAPRPNDLPLIAPRPCTITEIIMPKAGAPCAPYKYAEVQ